MNNYSFEDVAVGTTESFSVRVTDQMMDAFRAITGDINPLHLDDAFAQMAGYVHEGGGHVVFGMLTASFFSTLAGVYLPGRKSVIQTVEINFVRPVWPGDELVIAGTCIEKDNRFQTITLKTSIRGGGRRENASTWENGHRFSQRGMICC